MKSIANTTIRFGMIALPVQVAAATETASDVSFGQASPAGEVLRQVYLDPNGNEVPRDDILKGVWDGQDFKAIDKDAITQISEATKIDDLSILEIIDQATIPTDRITGKYFIQSHQKMGNINAFKLFVDALDAEGMAAITKWTARSRQKLMVIYPQDGNLVGLTLSFQSDVRSPDDAVEAHKAGTYSVQELQMARQLLQGMANGATDELDTQIDEAIPLKADLVQKALAGQAITIQKPAQAAQAMDTLADSLAAMLEAQKAEGNLREAANA